MQIRVCPECGSKNPIAFFECGNCGRDLTDTPYSDTNANDGIEKKAYIECPSCGEKYYIQGGKYKKILLCKKCRSPQINTLTEDDIQYESQDQTKQNTGSEVEEELEISDDNGLKKATGSKKQLKDEGIISQVLLTNIEDGKKIAVDPGKAVLGAYGDYEPDYFWNLNFVSGRHLIMNVTGDSVKINDTQSTNGTKINGKMIRRAVEYELSNGDILTMGDQDFRVKICW